MRHQHDRDENKGREHEQAQWDERRSPTVAVALPILDIDRRLIRARGSGIDRQTTAASPEIGLVPAPGEKQAEQDRPGEVYQEQSQSVVVVHGSPPKAGEGRGTFLVRSTRALFTKFLHVPAAPRADLPGAAVPPTGSAAPRSLKRSIGPAEPARRSGWHHARRRADRS